DRTAGTNPIRQQLANLDEAGQLYGPIIYQKAPIVMRQLEQIVGESKFRDGLRAYLKRYAFGNATWLDLVRMLDERTPVDVTAWSRAWVEERGRPSFTTMVRTDARDRLTDLEIVQHDPMSAFAEGLAGPRRSASREGGNRRMVWPQRLRVALGYPGMVRELPVYVEQEVTPVPNAHG